MMRHYVFPIAGALLLATPLAAQLRVPGPEVAIQPLGDVTGVLDDTLENVESETSRTAQRLLRQKDRALSKLLRQNRDTIERDIDGNLARRGELLALSLNEANRLALGEAGFLIGEREHIEGLDIAIFRLAIPDGVDLAEAQELAQSIAPDAEVSADNLHFRAGDTAQSAALSVPVMVQSSARIGVEVGIIDGASGGSVGIVGKRGFAKGAPRASDHGTAVVSLLRNAGVTRIRVADVYGTDPAGGGSRAIAQALGWLTASGSQVISISLVGPKNALVSRAIAAARAKGVVVVAAVGNDGPAAPPAYPASYSGVVSVTGVDRKGRRLIEAGRALGLDYAAPGAGVYAHDVRGKLKSWRGTSFATPLVAARVAAALNNGGSWRARLDREARDLGKRGPDNTYGRGLLCGGCGRKK